MTPDAKLKFIRTVAVVTAFCLLQNILLLPRKPAALGAKRNGKYIAISIKATKGAQGYQYQYATNSKMKNAKTKTTKARSYKFSASASKIYYVRARAYAKSGGKTYYSGWSSIRKVSKPGESDNKDGSPSSGPEKTPAPHKHNFVDAGVVAFDWTDGHKEPGYTGPTSTTEEVDGIYACVKCGCYYGTISGVWDVRYWNHAESECGCGAYSLRTVYAQYHLLECSTPGCYAYRRGKLAYYEYLMYFNGNGQMPTSFILKDWQIKELGLPMP